MTRARLLRPPVMTHGDEAADTRAAFVALPPDERDAVIEFLKSLQVMPPGSPSLVVDERGHPRSWQSMFEASRPAGSVAVSGHRDGGAESWGRASDPN